MNLNTELQECISTMNYEMLQTPESTIATNALISVLSIDAARDITGKQTTLAEYMSMPLSRHYPHAHPELLKLIEKYRPAVWQAIQEIPT